MIQRLRRRRRDQKIEKDSTVDVHVVYFLIYIAKQSIHDPHPPPPFVYSYVLVARCFTIAFSLYSGCFFFSKRVVDFSHIHFTLCCHHNHHHHMIFGQGLCLLTPSGSLKSRTTTLSLRKLQSHLLVTISPCVFLHENFKT